jgi:hypothetical protein
VVGRYPEGLASTNARAGVALFVLSVCALWVLLGCYDEPNAVIAIPGLPEIPVPTIQKG